jgi:hypothetical protein
MMYPLTLLKDTSFAAKDTLSAAAFSILRPLITDNLGQTRLNLV